MADKPLGPFNIPMRQGSTFLLWQEGPDVYGEYGHSIMEKGGRRRWVTDKGVAMNLDELVRTLCGDYISDRDLQDVISYIRSTEWGPELP